MREGGLDAPVRHPIGWKDPDFADPRKVDAELRRVFDICHSCRRCFNLCDAFPTLFDLIDGSESGELDTVASSGFASVADACTLCDMCFMASCPYVPPHEFNVDFAHLMLRYRAAALNRGRADTMVKQLTKTDRNARIAGLAPGLANWASDTGNRLTRPLIEKLAGVHRAAALPRFHGKTFAQRAKRDRPRVDESAPGFGRKAVLYATCFVNYNNPGTGEAARRVLARNGVETEVVYPSCCGMPQLEQGDIAKVAAAAGRIAGAMAPWIERGYDVIALTPSCALMLKFEWPLILPADAAVKRLAEATYDIAEYVVDIARTDGLAGGLQALDGGVALHLACHARAQNIGAKAAEMLRLVPGADVRVIERCSGHGGSWGIMKRHFETALKVGRPAARQAAESGKRYLASECPLAGMHLVQGIARLGGGAGPAVETAHHPIELFARAYGLVDRVPKAGGDIEGSSSMAGKHEITRDDIMPVERYAHERKERRRALAEMKNRRRMEVGPVCTFHFENYHTMWSQIHEMLFIEKGGAAQIDDELAAYNPLVPKGRELVATVMFEIDEPKRRQAFLSKLGGIEAAAVLRFAGETVTGRPEADVARSTPEGRASSVQFLHFPFSAGQVAKFRQPGVRVVVGFAHPHYGHMAVMPEAVRAALAEDFD
ncbi:MAG: DUF3501 family protein [Kiloniellaceae bacterium]